MALEKVLFEEARPLFHSLSALDTLRTHEEKFVAQKNFIASFLPTSCLEGIEDKEIPEAMYRT